MTGMRAFFGELVAQTLRDPQMAARRLIALNPTMEVRWLGLFLVTVVALFLSKATFLILPLGEESQIFDVIADPISGIPVQAGSLLLLSAAMAWIGRRFGGSGVFADALLLVVWLQVVMTLLQVVQFVVLLIIPPLGALLAFAVIGLFFWLMVQFTTALHGFSNPAKVFFGMIISFVVIATMLMLVLMLLGFTPPMQKV